MGKKPTKLKVEQANPRSLNASEYNPRRITPNELLKLRRSIRTFGFIEPVVVRAADNSIIGGHQRAKAAMLEGLRSIPVVRLKLTKEQAKTLNLALNRIHGEWDAPKLKKVLDELVGGEFDISLTGFDPEEIAELSKDSQAAIEQVDLRPPPTVVWVLCAIPLDVYGEVRDHVVALQARAGITVQASRDTG